MEGHYRYGDMDVFVSEDAFGRMVRFTDVCRGITVFKSEDELSLLSMRLGDGVSLEQIADIVSAEMDGFDSTSDGVVAESVGAPFMPDFETNSDHIAILRRMQEMYGV